MPNENGKSKAKKSLQNFLKANMNGQKIITAIKEKIMMNTAAGQESILKKRDIFTVCMTAGAGGL